MSKKPFFICDHCDSDYNCHKADDLRVFEGKLICENCHDASDENEIPHDWRDLPIFIPEKDSKIKELNSRAETAEAGAKDIKDAAAMVLFDIAEMRSTEGLNRLVLLASLCECDPVEREGVLDWQARAETAEKRVKELEGRVKVLEKTLEAAADDIQATIPEKNCSCHLSPPCGDCVDHGVFREILEYTRDALCAALHADADLGRMRRAMAGVVVYRSACGLFLCEEELLAHVNGRDPETGLAGCCDPEESVVVGVRFPADDPDPGRWYRREKKWKRKGNWCDYTPRTERPRYDSAAMRGEGGK